MFFSLAKTTFGWGEPKMTEQLTEDQILSEDNLQVSKALRDLSDIEEKLEKIDEQVNKYRISITEPVYDQDMK